MVSCLAASLSCLALSVNLKNSALSRNHSFLQFSLSAFAAQAVGTVIYAVFFFLEFPVWQYVAILSLYTFLADAALILLFSAVSALSLNKLDQKLNEYQNNNQFYFEITKRIPGKLGRAGIIHTPHGDIHTPAFMTVGTRGEVRYLSMDDLKSISAQAMLSNGYHLRNISQEIADQGGLAKWSGWNGPTLTDSGGFQVMSPVRDAVKLSAWKKNATSQMLIQKDRLAHVTEKVYISMILLSIRTILSGQKNPWKFSAASVRTYTWHMMSLLLWQTATNTMWKPLPGPNDGQNAVSDTIRNTAMILAIISHCTVSCKADAGRICAGQQRKSWQR